MSSVIYRIECKNLQAEVMVEDCSRPVVWQQKTDVLHALTVLIGSCVELVMAGSCSRENTENSLEFTAWSSAGFGC